MKILVLHSRYLSGDVSGENRVVEDETHLLREAGHDIQVWQPSVDEGRSSLYVAVDAVWSRSATKHVRQLVLLHRPDVVHVHSLYPRLSPAILRAVPRTVPIVVTLHNFRLMCLPATYLRDGRICEDCALRLPWRGIVHACYRDSRPASAALATSLTLHRALDTFSRVARYLAVSRFVRDKHVEIGLEAIRIGVKSNFAWPADRREGPGKHVLFVGRITREKGLETVLRALPEGLELVVAGDGPERRSLSLRASAGVSFLGQVEASEVSELLRNARALVVPSVWYEGQPRVIVEAFAAGVPVLASRIGGLPELVQDGINGYLADPADEDGWRRALEAIGDDDRSRGLGAGASETWQRRFTPAIALRETEDVYAGVISRARGTRISSAKVDAA